ncbi:hypothetical protein LWI29_011577 [Acer saccharum]|uniref:Uncharacterized protein n=1 Tax=Acer saccharum TaxID=4024 RepID=A0AA39VI01_ACESA|nr:hypothetical protein LWI29_011577 [Acer saccharum]
MSIDEFLADLGGPYILRSLSQLFSPSIFTWSPDEGVIWTRILAIFEDRAKAIVEASRRDDAEHEASGIDPSQVEKANEETDEVVPAGPRESETYRSLVSEAHETDYEIITPIATMSKATVVPSNPSSSS